MENNENVKDAKTVAQEANSEYAKEQLAMERTMRRFFTGAMALLGGAVVVGVATGVLENNSRRRQRDAITNAIVDGKAEIQVYSDLDRPGDMYINQ